jgi:hypothetical protein
MRFRDIKEHIVNREGIESIDALRQAGYRLVKARDSDRHFLARPDDLQPLLVRLGDIAEVRFGIKTGANEFFYLEPVGTTVAELFRAGAQQPSQPTVRVRNGAGWQGELETAWLRPVIKSPRELKTLRVRLEDLRYLVACTTPPTSSNATQRHTPTSSGANGRGITCARPVRAGKIGGN